MLKSACHLIGAVTDEKLTVGNATLKTAAIRFSFVRWHGLMIVCTGS